MTLPSALYVTPGRGSYSRDTLGYLAKYNAHKMTMLSGFDAIRTASGQESISLLDSAAAFSPSRHLRGDNASALIYACSLADFASVDRDVFEIVAVTGNSMGWYTALSCAGAVTAEDGFKIANTMGTLMQAAMIGGQMLYPFVDENWIEIPGERARLQGLADEIQGLFISIDLGGMLVFAGEDGALREAESRLKRIDDRYPMRLANHAGFHSPLQAPVSESGLDRLPLQLFGQPDLPLIDGRGHVWLAKAGGGEKLRAYTLGHQVTETYDFSAAIRSALHEFAPDVIIAAGPGNALGAAIGQTLVAMNWKGLKSKQDFTEMQARNPIVLSMGLETQRALATGREDQ
jgi:[acyl-carrier-protein] S-malonyltransferase